MEKLFDLHLHSVFSDGKDTPAQICGKAKAAGLYGFAITDHDTVAGLGAAEAEARRQGLCFVPGIEVSAYGSCEIHILGLNIDYENKKFLTELNGIRAAREVRNLEIIRKLNALGISVTPRDIERAGPGSSGRAHIAKAIEEKGYAPSVQEAFGKYLAEGRPAYSGNVKVPPEKAIALIRSGRGESYLAHPGRLSLDDKGKFALIGELRGAGLDGIEAYYPGHSPAFTRKLLKAAAAAGLLICGGTDNHGRPGDAPIGSVSAPYTKA